MAVISINLGVLNLLPVPVLDGGHILFLGIEAVRRRPLSEKVIMVSQRIGLALLLALMAFAFYNDIMRLITGKTF
jgi:regulator of sigma E protease